MDDELTFKIKGTYKDMDIILVGLQDTRTSVLKDVFAAREGNNKLLLEQAYKMLISIHNLEMKIFREAYWAP